jgi:hypothetical protein
MQRLAQYLEHAQKFEQLSAEEAIPQSKPGSKLRPWTAESAPKFGQRFSAL